MSRIQIMSSELADQIAAGEVVERPASVVKELVENALDAGAGRIEVEIAAGGRERIAVTDDGGGMTAEEARLALVRHATSKLRAFDELLSLRTMGFRGEALPSIAAVSRLRLTTRPADAIEASVITVEGGLVEGGAESASETPVEVVGAPRGTRVEVSDLFYNVPARLKFLKADATETAHVIDTVLRLAVAHPEVHFRLRTDSGSRPAVDLPPHRSLLERATAALSRRGAVYLHPAEGSEHGVCVTACLAAPSERASTTRNTFLYVNRRFLRDRGLLQALSMGYGELLERGRYPTAVVSIEVPPGSVDVNVHPQKTEVRFVNANEVQAAVRHVVRQACAKAPWLSEPAGVRVYHLPPDPMSWPVTRSDGYSARERDDDSMQEALRLFSPRPGTPPTLPGLSPRERSSSHGDTYARPSPRYDRPFPRHQGESSPGPYFPRLPLTQPGTDEDTSDAGPARDEPQEQALIESAGERADEHREVPQDDRGSEPRGFFSSLRYLGQAHRTYLVCEGAGEVVLIDQHAAHERVAFERLRLAHQARAVRTQRLLFPHRIELDEAQAAAAVTHAEVLRELGFDIEHFGGQSFAVKAVPELLGEDALDRVLPDALDELGARGASEVVAERLDHLYATMACHSVVRAGDILDERRVRALLDSMDGIDFRAHCPHGRPVLLRLSIGELERRFGRA